MPERRFAVLIGNANFLPEEKGLPSLRCPARDVSAFAEVLANPDHGPYTVSSLVDAASNEALQTIYSTLTREAERDDVVLIYYSGHGKPDEYGDLHLATSNTRVSSLPLTSIPVETLGRWMQRSKCQRIILILDCCYSGAVDRIFAKGELADQVSVKLQNLSKDVFGRGLYVLTASTDVQVAEEKEGDTYGLLTKHILAGIVGGEADKDDDGLVSMHELLIYVQHKVASEGAQTPQGWAFRQEGGDLAVARTGRASGQARRKVLIRKIYAIASEHVIPHWVVRTVLDVLDSEPKTTEREAKIKKLIYTLTEHSSDNVDLVETLYEVALEIRTGLLHAPEHASLLPETTEATQEISSARDAPAIPKDAVEQDEKVRVSTEAIRIKPDDAVASDNPAQADLVGIQDYEEAIRLRPDDALAFFMRGMARYKRDDYVGAIQDYDEAIRLRPDDAVAFNNRGMARYKRDDYVGAIQDYDEAIRLRPDVGEFFKNRAYVRMSKNGQLFKGLTDYWRAKRLGTEIL